ncbi:hypothetical protein JXL21_11205 [Candidatus Bathyarchaeota archaeon]|nr:hypothetical protein [Candidatus Bathyarchaeota archaeon]
MPKILEDEKNIVSFDDRRIKIVTLSGMRQESIFIDKITGIKFQSQHEDHRLIALFLLVIGLSAALSRYLYYESIYLDAIGFLLIIVGVILFFNVRKTSTLEIITQANTWKIELDVSKEEIEAFIESIFKNNQHLALSP